MPKVLPLKRKILASMVVLALPVLAWPPTGRISYISYEDAKPILDALDELVPPELHGIPRDKRESAWPAWVKTRDTQIRERLRRGDEDSVVNFLLFGISYTQAPRLSSAQLRSLERNANSDPQDVKFRELLDIRVRDLVAGMSAPGNNERLGFAREVAERAGIDMSSEAGKSRVRAYLLENIRRTMNEQSGYRQALMEAARLNDPTEEFAERSKLYKERGLSLDASLPPNYALERALAAMQKRGLLASASVRRVGIIGPGLDFTDKHEGYDFYPVQTLQPFAILDSLLRLGLASAADVEIDTLDLSSRVNDHVRRARSAALRGGGYTVQIPFDLAWKWKGELQAYWHRFGDQIAVEVKPVALPKSLQGIEVHAVRVRSEFVQRLRPLDINIVLQREEVPEEAKFDLLIATNVLVYYDTFEHSLALANIQSMLRPGGYLLTNNLLLELPFSKMKGGGYVSVEYSDRESDGDRILWYRRES